MPHGAEPTDEELIAGARRGDSRAFQLLVERYEGKVAAVIVGMLGWGPEAEDVGQETFIRFYRAIDRFRGEASVGTYITRIAINQSLKALKKRKRWHERIFSRDEEMPERAEEMAEFTDIVDERERRELVRRSLQQLSLEQRSVVVLRILEGYSTRETSELLGVPEGTVMSRLSRALSRLEELLGPQL